LLRGSNTGGVSAPLGLVFQGSHELSELKLGVIISHLDAGWLCYQHFPLRLRQRLVESGRRLMGSVKTSKDAIRVKQGRDERETSQS
jgi:hypothetical protein